MDTHDKHKYDGKEDRNYYQKPFDEVTDELPQIDDESASLADRHEHHEKSSGEGKAQAAKDGDGPGEINEINDTDVRDQADSTRDWDAENNRTGRNK